jgi:two-component system alkaline phosphatase synthesis response regulator PhoP
MRKKICVIDDEKDILDIIKMNLQDEGYDLYCFSSGEEAFQKLNSVRPDLFILDIMMPGMDGYDFCRRVRAADDYRDIPIIFLSAKSDELDKVLGLELGGDDYMTKPFSVKELKSRVKAVLRRVERPALSPGDKKKISYEGIEIDPHNYTLVVDGKDVDLTKSEFDILHLLLMNPGKIFTRDNIIDSIKGNDVYVIDRTVDVHIMNLRKKLGRHRGIIRTFSGVGYGFRK